MNKSNTCKQAPLSATATFLLRLRTFQDPLQNLALFICLKIALDGLQWSARADQPNTSATLNLNLQTLQKETGEVTDFR